MIIRNYRYKALNNKQYILNIIKLLILNKKYSFNKKYYMFFRKVVSSLIYTSKFNNIIKKYFGTINNKLYNILYKIRLFKLSIIFSGYRIGDGSSNYIFLLI